MDKLKTAFKLMAYIVLGNSPFTARAFSTKKTAVRIMSLFLGFEDLAPAFG